MAGTPGSVGVVAAGSAGGGVALPADDDGCAGGAGAGVLGGGLDDVGGAGAPGKGRGTGVAVCAAAVAAIVASAAVRRASRNIFILPSLSSSSTRRDR